MMFVKLLDFLRRLGSENAAPQRPTTHEATLRLTNTTSTARMVVLEPWTDEFSLAPGASLDITVTGGDPADPILVEVAEDADYISGSGSIDTRMFVVQDGKQIWASWTA